MGLSHQMVLVAGLLIQRAYSVELSFGLEKGTNMCFYERIDKGVLGYVEYQMIEGESNNIDLQVKGPNKEVVYSEQNRYEDKFTWTATATGVYSFCFSSEQFTRHYKLIYFDLEIGDDNAVAGQKGGTRGDAMTLMETSSYKIHNFLSKARNMQTFFRNREAGGRQFAQDLNLHVILWSLGETVAVLVIGLGQVLILRSFFSGPSPRSGTAFANGRIST